jgi:hypothetical protein
MRARTLRTKPISTFSLADLALEYEVSDVLGLLDGLEAFDRFEFDDDQAIDDEVEAKAAIDLTPL